MELLTGPDLTEHLDEQPDVGVDLLLASATARVVLVEW